jgi:hypothetical protein
VIDGNDKRLIKVEVSTKHSQVIAGPNKIAASGPIAAYTDKVYLANNEGIFEISEEKKKVLDKNWEDPILLNAFAGNLYVLDKTKSMFLRFQGNGDKFSTGKQWLSEDTKIDLKDVTSWTIDGNIWALRANGEIIKFSQGNNLNFRLDVPGSMDFKADFIFTDDTSDYLYFLDKTGGSIKAFDKKGTFKAQYISEEIKSVNQFTVSEKDKKIILLTGKMLLTLPVKHF